ncbi:hypothetical protein L1887_14709 [Cichorium endivia]|nr:hypothetical protein L1887_14709 [Cichorium endivia]
MSCRLIASCCIVIAKLLYRTYMASNNDNAKKKFDWSDNFVMILCDILKKYIMKNGRTSPIKWLELQPTFERVANTKLHSYKALKNKYDGMRKDYNLWKSLRNGETGLGWNETTRQLNCSDEWWDKKVKENPNVKAIRKKQPSSELQEAWDQIFGDAVASGTYCVAPSMDPSTFSDMHHVIIDDENPTTGDENEDGTFFSSQFPQDSPHLENLENADGTYFSNLMNFASDVLFEGMIFSIGGNGRSYVVILESGPSGDTSQSSLYFSRISTKIGFCRVRVPFSSFRPVNLADPPLDPFLVHTLTIRFEPIRQRPSEGAVGGSQDLRSFQMILEYIKAFPWPRRKNLGDNQLSFLTKETGYLRGSVIALFNCK